MFTKMFIQRRDKQTVGNGYEIIRNSRARKVINSNCAINCRKPWFFCVAAERSIFGAISSRWVYLFARTYTPRL